MFNKTLARLMYIKQRGGIMLLTGDPGAGKTITISGRTVVLIMDEAHYN